jgi:small subunit ribosomal protein S4e
MKRHMKRLTAPRSWRVGRKAGKFILRPHPGAHSLKTGMPLAVLLRDYLGYATTLREARQILSTQEVLVDDIRRKNPRFMVGLLDVIRLKAAKESYRIVIGKSGHLEAMKIPDKEALHKPRRITSKTKQPKGATQLGFFDGYTAAVKDDTYKVGDTLLIEFPGRVMQHFKMQSGSLAYITGGRHQGVVGIIDKVGPKGMIIKAKKSSFRAQKRHVFVIGDKQPCITLP